MLSIINNFKEYNTQLNKSEKTIKNYTLELNVFLREFNINSIDELKQLEDKDFIKNWLNKMNERNYSASTINKKKTVLSVFSNYLILENIISKNKFKQLANIKNDNVKIDIYTNEETEKILNLLDEKCSRATQRNIDKKINIMYKAIFNIFFNIALRNEEVTRIQINDINWETGQLYVRAKGHKGEISHKSKMNEKTLSIVKDWLEIRKTMNIDNEDKELLFVSLLSKKGVTTDAIRKQMKSIQKELGIQGDKMVHTIRHTRISNLVAKGVDVKKVSLFAHHASQSTTEKYYIRATDNLLDELSDI